MLVLTRRAGESIHLGDDIVITILSLKGKQVKIGLAVPEDMPVYRDEVYRRVQEQNRLAIQSLEQDVIKVTELWKRKER